jgi:MFS family permease
MGSLYVSQYVGQAFLLISLITIMRHYDFPVEKISLAYIMVVFWVFKFIWAPVIDKYMPICGRYKGWLLITQSGMGLSLIILSFFQLPEDFYLVLIVGTIHSFFSSTQDVASDALSRTLLLPNERPAGMSVQAFSGLVGNIIGGGLVLSLYPYLEWSGCCFVLTGVVMACFIQCLFLKEPSGPKDNSRISLNRLIKFWQNNHNFVWLILIILYSIGIGLSWGMLPILLTEYKWGYGQIGMTLNVAGSVTGMIAAGLSGKILNKIGRESMLKLMSLILIAGLIIIGWIVLSAPDRLMLFITVQIYFLIVAPSMVLLPTLMMDRASAKSPATDYTVQFCLLTIFQYVSATLGTRLGPQVGFGFLFLFCAALEILALVYALRLIYRGLLLFKLEY